jgi:hypothetical protein
MSIYPSYYFSKPRTQPISPFSLVAEDNLKIIFEETIFNICEDRRPTGVEYIPDEDQFQWGKPFITLDGETYRKRWCSLIGVCKQWRKLLTSASFLSPTRIKLIFCHTSWIQTVNNKTLYRHNTLYSLWLELSFFKMLPHLKEESIVNLLFHYYHADVKFDLERKYYDSQHKLEKYITKLLKNPHSRAVNRWKREMEALEKKLWKLDSLIKLKFI